MNAKKRLIEFIKLEISKQEKFLDIGIAPKIELAIEWMIRDLQELIQEVEECEAEDVGNGDYNERFRTIIFG